VNGIDPAYKAGNTHLVSASLAIYRKASCGGGCLNAKQNVAASTFLNRMTLPKLKLIKLPIKLC